MTHRIEIADSTDAVQAESGETILDACLRAGVSFSHSCQAGNCGNCKCEHLEGEVFELESSEHALSAEERARNLILACRSQVWSDVRVRRLEAGDVVLHPSRVMCCRVSALRRLTHDISEVRLTVEAGGPFMFSAGQYAQIEFAPGLARRYSMANTPDESGLVFQIRHMPGGRTSSFVATQLMVGDDVKVSGPHGASYLRDAHAGPVLLVAGGSGLAPAESILRTLLGRNHPAPVHLYFGVRAERDVYHEAELAALAARHPNFHHQIVLSEQTDARERRSGFVHEAVATDHADFAGWKAYLAGPPVMVEAATALLRSRAVELRDIHADAFYHQN